MRTKHAMVTWVNVSFPSQTSWNQILMTINKSHLLRAFRDRDFSTENTVAIVMQISFDVNPLQKQKELI